MTVEIQFINDNLPIIYPESKFIEITYPLSTLSQSSSMIAYPLLTLSRGEQVAVSKYWPQGDQLKCVLSEHSVSPIIFRVAMSHICGMIHWLINWKISVNIFLILWITPFFLTYMLEIHQLRKKLSNIQYQHFNNIKWQTIKTQYYSFPVR